MTVDLYTDAGVKDGPGDDPGVGDLCDRLANAAGDVTLARLGRLLR
jgi:hypothetical protein